MFNINLFLKIMPFEITDKLLTIITDNFTHLILKLHLPYGN